jgi:hypothetical protein
MEAEMDFVHRLARRLARRQAKPEVAFHIFDHDDRGVRLCRRAADFSRSPIKTAHGIDLGGFTARSHQQAP